MPIQTVSPAEARHLIERGAVLIDIRSPEEHARERIAGARNVPVSAIARDQTPGEVLVFHCKSGMRTAQNAHTLESAADGRDCYIVDGGIDRWGSDGLPIERAAGAPLEMQRQVMIAAGTLVLTGTLLSLWISPRWIGLAIFVGAGLIFAGITGYCGMATLLAAMPWNRRTSRG